MWHTNMTTEEWLREAERHREREILRLRGLANFYSAEAEKLEKLQRQSRDVRKIHAPATLQEGNTEWKR